MVSDSKSLSGHKRSHSRNRCGKGKQKSNRASDAELCRHRPGSPRREFGVRRRSHPARRPFDISPRRAAGDLRHRHRSDVSQEFVHSAHFHFIPAMTPLSLQGNANVMHLLDQAETGYWRSNFAWLRLSCAPMGCPPGPFAGRAGT